MNNELFSITDWIIKEKGEELIPLLREDPQNALGTIVANSGNYLKEALSSGEVRGFASRVLDAELLAKRVLEGLNK